MKAITETFFWYLLTHVQDPESFWRLYRDARGRARPVETPSRVYLRKPWRLVILIREGTSDIGVLREVFAEQNYDVPVGCSPSVIVDVGANIGLTSLFFAKRYPTARVFAFEPVEANFSICREQLSANGCQNVECLPFGWGRDNAERIMSLPAPGRYGDISMVASGASVARYTASIRNAAEVLDQLGVERVDLLKMDVEGAEYEIIPALKDWMRRIRCLVGEIHVSDQDVSACLRLLAMLGETHEIDILKKFGWRGCLFRAWLRE